MSTPFDWFIEPIIVGIPNRLTYFNIEDLFHSSTLDPIEEQALNAWLERAKETLQFTGLIPYWNRGPLFFCYLTSETEGGPCQPYVHSAQPNDNESIDYKKLLAEVTGLPEDTFVEVTAKGKDTACTLQ